MNQDILLTVAIPCYNSEAYMKNAINSLLGSKDFLEILVVNDGSKDSTPQIGQEYERAYPGVVRLINKENGGHGDAVMAGLREARGIYYKVLDSDDWLDNDGLKKVVQFLGNAKKKGTEYDMLITNYVYEKQGAKLRTRITYKSVFPQHREFTWEDIGRFLPSQNILMHSVIYRTELLRSCGLHLPKHTFYVDNIYVYQPLPSVKRIYYMNVDLYHYYIGREDQSVNEKIMIGRVDQQLRVTRIMIQVHKLKDIKSPKLRSYMTQYLAMIMTISTVLLLKEGSKESLKKRRDLWNYLRYVNPDQYDMVKRKLLGFLMKREGPVWDKFLLCGYEMARKIFHFN